MNLKYLIPQGRVDMGSHSTSMMNKAPLYEISGQFSEKKCSYELFRQPHCSIVEMSCSVSRPSVRRRDIFLYWTQFSLLVFSSITSFLFPIFLFLRSWLVVYKQCQLPCLWAHHAARRSTSNLLSSFNCWNSVKMLWNNFSWNNYWPLLLHRCLPTLFPEAQSVNYIFLHSASILPN